MALRGNRFLMGATVAATLALGSGPAFALESIILDAPDATPALQRVLLGASALAQAERDGRTEAQDLIAAARADYGRLLNALYSEGYYSGVIRILIDGREASTIAPLDTPPRIDDLRIVVVPGPQFVFSDANVLPLPEGTSLSSGFSTGEIARSGEVIAASREAILSWRELGYAKANVATERLTADHKAATLAANIAIATGPRVTFGALRVSGYQRLSPERLVEIAGLPTGEPFSPTALNEVQARLRRTGIFSAASLTEAESLGADDTLDVSLLVAENKLRRLGFGAEISSLDGLSLSGFWLHRNLLGGGERLRLEGAISGIGAALGGADYSASARMDRPATLSPDTSAFAFAEIAQLNRQDYTSRDIGFGLGLSHYFSPRLNGAAAVVLGFSEVEDLFETTRFRQISAPVSATWDSREPALSAKSGYFLDATITPFLGFGATGTGAQLKLDARTYRAIGSGERFVLAARVQAGSVFGAELFDIPRAYLFYSGGGGTVRGQPFQSLGVEAFRSGNLISLGGASFAAFSGEIRADVTQSIGVVAFYDAGLVSPESGFGGGDWHAGAGIGLRYETGIGPIRLDVGLPVSGTTGNGAQIYIGIGQAF